MNKKIHSVLRNGFFIWISLGPRCRPSDIWMENYLLKYNFLSRDIIIF